MIATYYICCNTPLDRDTLIHPLFCVFIKQKRPNTWDSMISNMMFPSVILVVRLSSNRPIDSAQIVFSNLTLFNLSYTRYTDTLTILLFQLAPIISVSCQCDNIDAILTGNFDAGSAIVEESSIGTQQPNCSCRDDYSGFGF